MKVHIISTTPSRLLSHTVFWKLHYSKKLYNYLIYFPHKRAQVLQRYKEKNVALIGKETQKKLESS